MAAFVRPFEVDFKGHGEKFMRSMFTPQSDPPLIDRIGSMVLGANQDMATSALKNILTWYQNDAATSFVRLGDRLRKINADPKGENRPLDKPTEFNLALENIVKGLESAALIHRVGASDPAFSRRVRATFIRPSRVV